MSDLSTFLTGLGTVFTNLMDYVGTVFDFIIDNPVALLGLGTGLAFTIVAFARKVIRAR